MDPILNIMKLFNEEYPGKFSISKSRVNLWRVLLGDIDPELVMTAALHLVATRDDPFPPSIGQLREVAKNFQAGELAQPDALEAWGHVQARIQSDEAPLTDLEAQVLKQVGPVYDLRRSENPAADRAQFIQGFKQAVERRRRERLTLPTVKAVLERQVNALPTRPDLPQIRGAVHEAFSSEEIKNLLKGTGLIDE